MKEIEVGIQKHLKGKGIPCNWDSESMIYQEEASMVRLASFTAGLGQTVLIR